jgi:hypothetical protein
MQTLQGPRLGVTTRLADNLTEGMALASTGRVSALADNSRSHRLTVEQSPAARRSSMFTVSEFSASGGGAKGFTCATELRLQNPVDGRPSVSCSALRTAPESTPVDSTESSPGILFSPMSTPPTRLDPQDVLKSKGTFGGFEGT